MLFYRSQVLNSRANCLRSQTQGLSCVIIVSVNDVINFCNKKRNVDPFISNSQLPDFLGGSCSCPNEGGCMRSGKGPWNDPDIMKVCCHYINGTCIFLYSYFIQCFHYKFTACTWWRTIKVDKNQKFFQQSRVRYQVKYQQTRS